MIYFLTDWQSEQTQLESDVVFNVSKIVNEGSFETKIINTQFSSFLNYFTNQFEFYGSEQLTSLLDTVTEQFALTYAPRTMSDLHFPKNWEKAYTRTNVLLSQDGVVKAEVFFNSFGFISHVLYYSNLGREIYVYSEKGYVLCKQTVTPSGKQVEQKVFDEGGRLILTQSYDYVFIGDEYKKQFKKDTYQTFKEVCIELLNVALVNFNPQEDQLVIDGTSDWLMELVEGFAFPESVVYVFTGKTQDCISQINHHLKLIERGKKLITDNLFFKESIEKNPQYQRVKEKIKMMAIYPTTLSLGNSNTYSEDYVYWQIETLNSRLSVTLQDFLRMKLAMRELCLIIDSQNSEDEGVVQRIVTTFIVQNFEISLASPEYELVKQYYEALRNEEMTPYLRELFHTAKQENPEMNRLIEAYLFYSGITFKKDSSVQELKDEFQKVRVFIDQRDNYEFISHSLAVSAGIPILSKYPSPYLINRKNGFIFEEGQLLAAVKPYLSDPDQWNQNLVESVEVIESNSTNGLLHQWKEHLK